MGNVGIDSILKQRTGPAALLVGLLVTTLAGCASTRTADNIQSELARLREEQRVLIEEVAALRAAVRRLAGEPAAADQAPAAALVEPRAATPLASDNAEIVAVLDAYRQALEAEDIQRVREEVYGGILPADDLKYLRIWFDRTDQLQVRMDPRDLEVHDGTADAVVRQTMSYRLSRTAERRRVQLDLDMAFQRRGANWHVTNVQPRR